MKKSVPTTLLTFMLTCSTASLAVDRSEEFYGASISKGKTNLKLSMEHYQSKSLYTEFGGNGVITYQSGSKYAESGLQARINHGLTDKWQIGMILPANQIRLKTTEIIGGNTVTNREENGLGNLQLTATLSDSVAEDTYLFFESILGLPTDTRSQSLTGGATASIELSLSHYFGDFGLKGSLSRYNGAARGFKDWYGTNTYKVGASTKLMPNLYSSLYYGENDGYDFGELVLEKHLSNNRTLELTVVSDTEGNRDTFYFSLGLTVPLD